MTGKRKLVLSMLGILHFSRVTISVETAAINAPIGPGGPANDMFGCEKQRRVDETGPMRLEMMHANTTIHPRIIDVTVSPAHR